MLLGDLLPADVCPGLSVGWSLSGLLRVTLAHINNAREEAGALSGGSGVSVLSGVRWRLCGGCVARGSRSPSKQKGP